MDTVAPCENIQPIVNDNTITSDGTTILGGDDKAGIAAILEAVRQTREQGIAHGPLQVVLTIGEEIGMFGAKNLDYSKIQARKAVILDADGPLGNIVVQGPAKDVISAQVYGKAAHAGVEPEMGVSAIQAAAKAVSQMKLGRLDEETTANIGVIAGGVASNIVPEKAIIEGEARSQDEIKLEKQIQSMKSSCEDVAQKNGVSVNMTIEHGFPQLKVESDSPLLKCIRHAAAYTEVEYSEQSRGGGSDANILSKWGITAVNLGVGMQKEHSYDEYIKIDDLENGVRLLKHLLTN
jgi:tripeptide aminopeptidase